MVNQRLKAWNTERNKMKLKNKFNRKHFREFIGKEGLPKLKWLKKKARDLNAGVEKHIKIKRNLNYTKKDTLWEVQEETL